MILRQQSAACSWEKYYNCGTHSIIIHDILFCPVLRMSFLCWSEFVFVDAGNQNLYGLIGACV